MLSLGLLTACGSSGSGDDPKVDPVPVDPVPNDLESLDSVIIEETNENQLTALTIPEYKDTNSYDFTGADGDNVELSSEDGRVMFKVEPDFETQPVYNFIMTVTNASDQTKDINVTINIVDVSEDLNTLPLVITKEVTENQRLALMIPEYKDTNRYTFSGVDGDSVKLWAERQEVIFKYAPDYETKNSYNFIMTVTNAMEQTKDIDITINIKDISNAFIFEVLEGSTGSLELVLNQDDQETFDTYSFTIEKDGELYETVEYLDSAAKILPIKDRDVEVAEIHEYKIIPTTENGLPGFVIRPNWSVVKVKVIQWGDNSWKTLSSMLSSLCFDGDSYDTNTLFFSESPSAPDLAEVSNMSAALLNCDFVEGLSYWDVSNVTNMDHLFWTFDVEGTFDFESTFNTDISQWDTSSVESMVNMFNSAEAFDQDISDWNVGKVTACDNFKEGALLLTDAHTPDFQNCSLVAP